MSLTRFRPTASGVSGLLLASILVAVYMMTSPVTQKTGSPKSPAGRVTTLAGFDGDRAYRYLVEQCEIGPRISGTEGNRKLRRLMQEHFTRLGGEVALQQFTTRHPLTGDVVELENVVAAWHADRRNRVVIGAHFDTRPMADKETNSQRRAQPFLGANDGASGVAVLMELAHMLSDLKTTVGVDLVAFDAEELVYDEVGDYFLGSSHFADLYRKRTGPERYVAGFVVDMVGDRTLEILPDAEGQRQSPKLVDEVWKLARKLGATGFKTRGQYDVRDDHIPLMAAGIDAIDIIDFNYPHWHRITDTPDKCSAVSLAQVGGVLAEWLRQK